MQAIEEVLRHLNAKESGYIRKYFYSKIFLSKEYGLKINIVIILSRITSIETADIAEQNYSCNPVPFVYNLKL
jgi:hypothetical protein